MKSCNHVPKILSHSVSQTASWHHAPSGAHKGMPCMAMSKKLQRELTILTKSGIKAISVFSESAYGKSTASLQAATMSQELSFTHITDLNLLAILRD